MRIAGQPPPAPRHPTLVHALRAAADHPSGVTFVDLHERETFVPWREVLARAERAAAALVARGLEPRDRVAIVLRTEPAFLDAFLGAWLAGAVPVPLYPPVRLGRMDEYVAATGRMIAVSGARLVVSGGAVRRLLGAAVERGGPALGCLDAEGLRSGLPTAAPREARPEELALVQFSSGSTVDPKPVALTHAALEAQVDAVLAAVRPDAKDVLVSWLPLYHDMGLIGCLLTAMSYPGPLVLLAPEHFLARPGLWLRAIARHRGTISAAPSFAWSYAAERVRGGELAGLSLRSWRLALDGAEAVSAEAMRRFATRFAASGFDPGALVPVYGLSEATLAVTFGRPGRLPAGRRVDAGRLARDGRVAAGMREIVSVGTPVPGVDVEVRLPDGAPAGELRLGRIFVRGPSLMAGYLGDEEGTRRALVDGWLDTGDLGFVADGELHVHGRAKDVVVVRGANHAPEEFEAALAGVPGLRPGCAVAVGFLPPGGEGEVLAILAERARSARHGGAAAREREARLEDELRRAVLERTGIAPHTVRILDPGTLPRTSSGKLRRGEALRRHLAGTLAPPRSAGALRVALEAARSGLAYARLRRRGGA